jgi:hypothetical protein
MALTKLNVNVNNIQTLADQPTESATVIKQKFDKAGADIKSYINDTLTTEIDNTLATKQEVLDAVAGAVPAGSVTDMYLSNAPADIKQRVVTHLDETTNAHGGIVASSDVVTVATANKILKLNAGGALPANITGSASMLSGKSSSDFQNSNKSYGVALLTDAMGASATITKTIPLGGAYKYGKILLNMIYSDTPPGALVFVSTDSTKSIVDDARSHGFKRRDAPSTVNLLYSDSNGGNSTGVPYADVIDVYLNGNNLIITIKNATTARSLACRVSWEVW